MNIVLRPWQNEFIKIVNKLNSGQIINLYGEGGTGKTFIKHYYNRHNINYIEYEDKSKDYKRLIVDAKINVIISVEEIKEIKEKMKAIN